MCGRFTLTLDPEELREALKLGDMPPQWIPRYNVAPSQPVAAVTDAQTRAVDFLHWGLVPSWAKDINIGSRLIDMIIKDRNQAIRLLFQHLQCCLIDLHFDLILRSVYRRRIEQRESPPGKSKCYKREEQYKDKCQEILQALMPINSSASGFSMEERSPTG